MKLILWVVFNPLSVLSPALGNLTIINHFVITLIMFLMINNYSVLMQDLTMGVGLYLDATLFIFIVPLKVTHLLIKHKRINVVELSLSFIVQVVVVFSLLILGGNFLADLKN